MDHLPGNAATMRRASKQDTDPQTQTMWVANGRPVGAQITLPVPQMLNMER
jgi:hypothetical protein